MDEPIRQIVSGLKRLARAPVFALIMIGTLALGIGGTTAVFGLVHGVMLRPLPYPEPAELFRIANHTKGRDFYLSTADYLALEEQQTLFEGVAAMEWHLATLASGERTERITVHSATPGFLPLLGIRPAYGRAFTEMEGRPGTPKSALVSWGFWSRELGGDPAAVGGFIRLDGEEVPVAGVLPRSPGPLLEDAEILVPLQLKHPTRKGPFFLLAVGRLTEGASAAAAAIELQAISKRIFPLWKDSWPDQGSTWTLTDLKSYVLGDVGLTLLVLLSAALFVFLIVCTNATSLILARMWDRRGEMAVRSALGATRQDLTSHLLSESIPLALMGAGAGLALALFGIRLAATAGSGFFPRTGELGLTGPVLLFFVLASAGSLALVGFLPALRGSGSEVASALRQGGGQSTSGVWSRRARALLVSIQFSVSVPVLIGAGLLLVSFSKLARVDPGFDADRVLAFDVSLPEDQSASSAYLTAFWKALLGDLTAIPGVVEAGVGRGRPPSSIPFANDFVLEDQPVREGETQPVVPWVFASPEYLEALGCRLLAGRMFGRASDEAGPAVLVDKAWALRFYGSASNAVGRRFRSGGCTSEGCPWLTVVGVTEEIRYSGLKAANPGVMFLNAHEFPSRSSTIVVRADPKLEPRSLFPVVRETVRRANIQAAISHVASGRELLDTSLLEPEYLAILVGCFAAVSFLLAMLGIYGVMEHFVRHHRKEIGIRMALGADSASVVGLVLRRGMALVLLGSGAGLVGAAVLSRFMGALLFGVEPTDPVVFGSTLAAIFVAAWVACWGPALRAARVQPREVLVEE